MHFPVMSYIVLSYFLLPSNFGSSFSSPVGWSAVHLVPHFPVLHFQSTRLCAPSHIQLIGIVSRLGFGANWVGSREEAEPHLDRIFCLARNILT